MKLSRLSCAVAVLFAIAAFAQNASPTTDWIDSPEAYFVTLQERNEWISLRTDAEREQFKERYWARRDPMPSTPRNEFKEIVQGRIKVADKQFGLEGLRGSLTARGMAFIVLGSPAHARDTHNTPVQPGPNVAYSLNEGNETFSTWTYDQLRTPKLLAALHRASLELRFRIEPSRQMDVLEDPGVFYKLRNEIAELSLMTRPTGASRAELELDAIPGPALPKEIEQQLDAADARVPLAAATIWREDDTPITLVWLHAVEPASTSPLMLYGRVRDGEQKTVAVVAREARPSLGFTTHDHEMVIGSQLPLPPGTYDATFILTETSSRKILASQSGRIMVPANGPAFHVSSLLLTDTVAPVESTTAVSLGGASLRPRADATFSKAESMWFMFQVANPAEASAVKLRVTLRKRDGSSVKVSDIPAALQRTGPSTYVGGYELPLTSVPAGEYSLYVTVADGGREEVRRADFRVVEGTLR